MDEVSDKPQDMHRYEGAFRGEGFDLFVIQVFNRLLTLFTLGIYHAWAKARVYRFVLANLEFAGHRLRFLGQGREIFKGFIRAIFVLVVLYGILMGGSAIHEIASEEQQPVIGATTLFVCYMFFIIGITLFGEFAFFASRRWRASRVSWREIRFRITLRPWRGVKKVIWYRLLGAVFFPTLPLYYFRRMQLIYNNLRFGDLAFSFKGELGEYYVMCLRGFCLSVITLGVYLFWFLADLKRYRYNNLEIGGSHFKLDMSTADYAGLVIGNFFLIVFTLGIAMPWVTTRTQTFHMARLVLSGPLDLETAVQQTLQEGTAIGEGLEDIMDLDVGMGF